MELTDVHIGGLILEAAHLEKQADDYEARGVFPMQVTFDRILANYMRERVATILMSQPMDS